jgi:hypothetical protein
MNNKRHNIIDDAWDMKAELLGGATHTLRVGLAVNTVAKALPIIIHDVLKLAVEKPKIDHSTLAKDLPVLLHFQSDDAMVAILVVHDEVTNNIQCYPFSNLNEGGYWWLYEMGFDITKNGFIEIRPVHPLLEEMEFEPTKGMMDHVEALATLVGSFLHRLQAGEITVVEGTQDYSKINKKRVRNGREAIINDWNIEYVQ